MKRRAAHLFALSALAVAQPLYDLLGDNPEFFAAHGAGRLEILVFAVALLVLPPAVLVAIELVVGLAGERAAATVQLVFVSALAGLIALQATRRLDGSSLVALVLALLAGVAFGTAYAALPAIRTFVTVLAAAPVVFLGLFLLGSPVEHLIVEEEAQAQVARIPPARTPVVLVVLDELPLNSLLDAEGRIDPVRFPHFAALAREADWFPNATTVHEGTLWAVPAILTGRVPRPRQLPRAEDQPRNLFTLLGGRYRVEAFERTTHLCPASLCRETDGDVGSRLASLAEDSGVVYLHTVLPARLASRLPTVSESWAGFLEGGDEEPARFARFRAALRPTDRPALFYGHFLLPHSPWRHLPSGRTYDLRPPGVLWRSDEVWTDDEGLVVQSQQRHLLQTAYVDSLLGRLVAQLRARGMYDESLLVVVADHGISFRPGGKRRPVSESNVEDIAFVPFLVKRPGQRAGRVLRRHVQTIDVLPTITEVLGIESGWQLEGRSAYSAGPGPSVVAVAKDGGERVELPLDDAIRRRGDALETQTSLFGSRVPAATLFAVGPHRALLGRRPPSSRGAVSLDFVQQAAPGLVALGGKTHAEARAVAVVRAGRVVAVAPVFARRFWVLAPGEAESVEVVSLR